MNEKRSPRFLPKLSIRSRIVLGILATGGVALAIFAVLGATQTAQVTAALSDRLETSVSLLAEEQLINTVNEQAMRTNGSFLDVSEEVENLATAWESLQAQKQDLSGSDYWDAGESLTRLEAGQYGNSADDLSSVFVPATSELNPSILTDINTSAFLDFYAPSILESHPSLLAVYAIDTRGITRYYPNINLASVLPPDFDATSRPYFEITSPLFNPQRRTRWTIPYVDATGGGLVLTIASPIYIGDTFNGVVAADMQLTEITNQVLGLKIGETGYAFLLDDAGRIISMPSAGYELFGLNQAEWDRQEFAAQTLFGIGSDELQAAVRRMAAGGNGLLITNNRGEETYISYAPIPVNGYSLALVVPVSELQGAITIARNETQNQLRAGTRILVITMALLLLLAILISLAIGQVIAAPIARLTDLSNRIVEGDLNAQAAVDSGDEIGRLSRSFNTMTARLRELLQDLEKRVEERTAELAQANEKNERRAKQFEAIAQVASTISSTRDLDTLLPQITTAISAKFGFYHTGIFLLDSRKEYAVLSAANSEGGKRMLARNHRLKVGETGIVGNVTGTGKPRVALNTGEDAIFFNNPDLPDTHSEIAFPLRDGDEVIGALDVQSTEVNAFDQEDINILTTLADQVSIAIQNARQHEATQKALAESLAASRQFIDTGWQQFLKSQKIAGVRHTGTKTELLYTENVQEKPDTHPATDPLRLHRGEAMSLPIKLRGIEIGVVDVRSNDFRGWDQDELDIVNAIIERAAIAMENARLLYESQRQAAKEQKIGEVTAKIGASIHMRNVLQTAVEELGRALPGSEVIIQFETDASESSPV
jgi:GAF domain-containing protein/HAMP domain-containing protein